MPRIVFLNNKSCFKKHEDVKDNKWYDLKVDQHKIEDNDIEPPVETKSALTELEELTGLHKVKSIVKELAAFAGIQKKREAYNLRNEPLVLHMTFKGNPGTGKTTVARILGKLFKEIGILPAGHLVEVERADLVGEYIGHTAQKTREQIKKAVGGILFIDEAYSLARGGNRDFGKEAIDTLVKAMEDYKNELIVILAGYKKEMELFMLSNPGLKSRFPVQITFKDYSKIELMQIAEQMAREKEYLLDNGSKQLLLHYLNEENLRSLNFSNARLVRNIIESAIRKQALRLMNYNVEVSRVELMNLNREDFVIDKEDELF